MTRPVTLVTGASAGIGEAFARLCAGRGDALVLAARRRERLEALAAELGGRILVLPTDLARSGAPAGLVAAIEAEGLHVDTLINNAGFGLAGRFAELPPGRQSEMIDLNVRALTELARLVLPGMVERGRGAILNVASTGAFQPGPGIAVYFATKAYVLSFTEALHQELKGSGVKVSALCPGPVETEFGEVAGVRMRRFRRLTADPTSVARAGLRALDADKAVAIPGLANKLTSQASRFLPRAAMRRIVGRIKI